MVFNPVQDFYGSESFTVTVTDGQLSDSETFEVTVNAVNDAPVLADVSDVSFDEDGSSSIELSASDVDNADLTFSISGGSSIEAILVGSSVSFSAPADYNGSESFTISVTDGELEDSQNITVTVNAVNDAPVAQSLNIGIQEDESIVIQLVGSDVDTGNIL